LEQRNSQADRVAHVHDFWTIEDGAALRAEHYQRHAAGGYRHGFRSIET
jgi:hypothetical protein